jgi:hypothetical protein
MATYTPPKFIAKLRNEEQQQELAKLEEWIQALKLHPDEVQGFVDWWEDQHAPTQAPDTRQPLHPIKRSAQATGSRESPQRRADRTGAAMVPPPQPRGNR